MHMFVRKWESVRRIRILFYKFPYFCYNTDKKEAEQLREASILDNDILHEDSHAHVRQEMGISKND